MAHTKKINRVTGAASQTRYERILDVIKKEPNRKWTVHDIMNKVGYHYDPISYERKLEVMLHKKEIKSELLTTPEGIRTVYYANVQSV